MDHLYRHIVSLYEQLAILRTTAHGHVNTDTEEKESIEGDNFEAPSPIPRGISVGTKIHHLRRQIVSLYDQAASLRTTAHGHTPAEVIDPMQALADIHQRGPGFGAELDHMYRQIVSLHEQVASLRTTTHKHS
jgi:methyl coenzyme M reductase subunit D